MNLANETPTLRKSIDIDIRQIKPRSLAEYINHTLQNQSVQVVPRNLAENYAFTSRFRPT